MSLFFFVFIVAVVVFVLVIRDKKKTEEAWTRIATNLKLTYYDIGVPSLRGTFRDRKVHVTISREGHGSRSQTFTRVEVQYRRILETAFQLSRQDYLESVKSFLGSQDVMVGHSDFDAAFVVKGRDEKAVRELFQSKSIRKACQSLVSKPRYAEVNISNRKIEVTFPGKVSDTARIRAILNDLVEVAEVLENKANSKAKQMAVAPPPLPIKKEKPEVPEEWHGLEIETEQAQVPSFEEVPSEPVSPVVPLAEEEVPLVELDESASTIEVTSEEELAAPPGETISLSMIAEALLEEKIGRYEAGQRFDQLFKGESVQWTGTLQAIEPGSSDRVFGHGSGWIARVESDNLIVKYRIGKGRRKRIEKEIGSPVELKGTLLKYDPFTTTLYLQSDDPETSEPDHIISEIVPYSERIKKEMQSRPGEVREFS